MFVNVGSVVVVNRESFEVSQFFIWASWKVGNFERIPGVLAATDRSVARESGFVTLSAVHKCVKGWKSMKSYCGSKVEGKMSKDFSNDANCKT